MIFTPPRFIAVDDNEKHLNSIVSTFQRLGTACLGIRYDPSESLKPDIFRGVRCLFMDLHLTDAAMGSDDTRHFAAIASILEDVISETGGPFILVLWTAYEDSVRELSSYLEKGIEKLYARPLSVIPLAKENFIDVSDGRIKQSEELLKAVRNTIYSSPHLAVLLNWEADVFNAAGETLASLLSLIPAEQRTSEKFSDAFDTILSRLAIEAVGQSHVGENPRAAIVSAFSPILSDRISHQRILKETEKIWQQAITKHNDKNLNMLSAPEAGKINRMLHLALPESGHLFSTDWGAVIELPEEWDNDNLKYLTGLTKKEILCEEFKLRSKAVNTCRMILIRVGAACDYAQNSRGTMTFLLGANIPESAERQLKDGSPLKLSDAIWQSPVFLFPGEEEEASRLYVHMRFVKTCLPEDCSEWKVYCRIREQLLMHLINAFSNYTSRPGIIQLPTE